MDSQELLLPQHYSTRNKTNTSDVVTPPPHIILMGPYNLQRTKNERDKLSAYIIQKEDTFQIKKIPKKKSGAQPIT